MAGQQQPAVAQDGRRGGEVGARARFAVQSHAAHGNGWLLPPRQAHQVEGQQDQQQLAGGAGASAVAMFSVVRRSTQRRLIVQLAVAYVPATQRDAQPAKHLARRRARPGVRTRARARAAAKRQFARGSLR
jgi:hypothetical protein